MNFNGDVIFGRKKKRLKNKNVIFIFSKYSAFIMDLKIFGIDDRKKLKIKRKKILPSKKFGHGGGGGEGEDWN